MDYQSKIQADWTLLEFVPLSSEVVSWMSDVGKAAYEKDLWVFTAKAEPTKSGDDKTVPYWALHAEREKRKAEAEAREIEKKKNDELLKELETFRAERDEKEKAALEAKMKEDWEYKKVLEIREVEISNLTTKLADLQTQLKTFEDNANNEIIRAISEIESKEDVELIEQILEGKTVAEKQAVLPSLISKFTKTAINANEPVPNLGGKKDVIDETELTTLQDKQKTVWLSPSEKIKMMTYLSKKESKV